MKRTLLPYFLCLISLGSFAQQVRREMPPEAPLDTISDEFNGAGPLEKWKQLHAVEGGPAKIKSMKAESGSLVLTPYATGWYGDYQGPFLFKTVGGNFDVCMRIQVSGEKDSLPQSEWSLAGLMVRQARPATNWEPRSENWLFLTTGIAEPKGSPVFEAKTTNNSVSNLKLRPAKAGWVELRIVRVQSSFLLMYRYDGEQWTLLERFYRPLLPYELQVGFNAYSGWNAIPNDIKADAALFNKTLQKELPADMKVQIDYVRFSRPALDMEKLRALAKPGFRAPYYTPANLLSDYAVSDAEVLGILK